MIHELIANYGGTALSYALAALGALLAWAVFDKIKSDRIRGYVSALWDETRAAVSEVGQTYASALKEANEDGVLTDEEKRKAKSLAIEAAKSNLGPKGVKALARVFDVDAWVGNKIEAILGSEKAATKKP